MHLNHNIIICILADCDCDNCLNFWQREDRQRSNSVVRFIRHSIMHSKHWEGNSIIVQITWIGIRISISQNITFRCVLIEWMYNRFRQIFYTSSCPDEGSHMALVVNINLIKPWRVWSSQSNLYARLFELINFKLEKLFFTDILS